MSAPSQPSIEFRQLEGLVDFLEKEKAEKALLVARDEGEAEEALPSEDPTAWDGRFEVALSVFIRQYLASAPPPPRATLAQDAQESARRLESEGRDRLRAAGARPLRAVR